MESVKSADLPKAPDRVILDIEVSQLAAGWAEQLNARAEGLIRFTKHDVVNFILRHHSRSFSPDEAQAISTDCFDETRWLAWAMERTRAAKKRGEVLTHEDLMQFRMELLEGSRKLRRKSMPSDTNSESKIKEPSSGNE